MGIEPTTECHNHYTTEPLKMMKYEVCGFVQVTQCDGDDVTNDVTNDDEDDVIADSGCCCEDDDVDDYVTDTSDMTGHDYPPAYKTDIQKGN